MGHVITWIHNHQKIYGINKNELKKIVQFVFDEIMPLFPSCEVSVSLVGVREMARLNQQFLHHSGATDVISFKYWQKNSKPKDIFSELIICPKVAQEQSNIYKNTFRQEILTYVVHGLLHTMGYDDHNVSARKKMWRCQNRILKKFLA